MLAEDNCIIVVSVVKLGITSCFCTFYLGERGEAGQTERTNQERSRTRGKKVKTRKRSNT